jgi:hypothetical protein
VDVEGLRRTVQLGLNEGAFSLLYLWIRFWANGGCARLGDLAVFVSGLGVLSADDVLALRAVVAELNDI